MITCVLGCTVQLKGGFHRKKSQDQLIVLPMPDIILRGFDRISMVGGAGRDQGEGDGEGQARHFKVLPSW